MFDQSYVKNGVTGYVVSMNSKEEMAEAIAKIVVMDRTAYAEMSSACREVAEKGLSQSSFVNGFDEFARCLGK